MFGEDLLQQDHWGGKDNAFRNLVVGDDESFKTWRFF